MTAPALRPYLPKDAPVLAELFQLSVEELTQDDYDADQRLAWAAVADDVADFGAWLGRLLTLVVDSDSGPVGFAALEDNNMIALLYVRPDFARRGVATLLCDALEKLAAARGTEAITTDASDTAQPFFAGRGYVAQQRNTVIRNGEWLANTTMTKRLAPAAAGRG